MSYGRSKNEFFNLDGTKQAIVKLASCERLVIYCGAGVTIDRTGLTWGDLVVKLFETSDGNHPGPDPSAAELNILKQELTPLQLASVLAERTEEHHATEKEARYSLIPKLQQALYTGAGWQSGALVSNIIRLSSGLVQLGKKVAIITSNYDIYLEDEYDHYRTELRANPDLKNSPPPDIAGLRVCAAGMKKLFRDVKPEGNAGRIEILYLHGRVPSKGGLGGRLALSEKDYHYTSDAVVGALQKSFSQPKTGILILGTSLSDPPLLKALFHTHPYQGEKNTPEWKRVALVPATSTGFVQYNENFDRLVQSLKMRTNHFGVELLVPDFHFQIAQFCQEILTAIYLSKDTRLYMAPSSSALYNKRIGRWWSAWQEQERSLGPDHMYKALNQSLKSIKELLGRNAGEPARELMKVELWVRHDPASVRRLALWGASTGILEDRSVLHFEELDLNTNNASVRAFIEGRPQYVARRDLNSNGAAADSRWKSYLSVPIRINLPDGTVPVGVITLASMEEKEHSKIPAGSVREMTSLVNQLTAVGQELLAVRPSTDN
ncbi:MAG: SIR2 family protein [Actinobacteria bacterium]|nr:SIR2 family protein [Actinomycetota bacterium]